MAELLHRFFETGDFISSQYPINIKQDFYSAFHLGHAMVSPPCYKKQRIILDRKTTIQFVFQISRGICSGLPEISKNSGVVFLRVFFLFCGTCVLGVDACGNSGGWT
jgi:hypothetical protein